MAALTQQQRKALAKGFARRLREAMRLKGERRGWPVTQRELAQAAGVNARSAANHWMQGNRVPSGPTLVRIAQYLDVEPNELTADYRPPRPRHRAEAQPAAQPHGRGYALVVDDDDVARATLAELVTRLGFETAVAASVKEAREKYQPNPDVVLVDQVLPDGRGSELMRDKEVEFSGKLLVSGEESHDTLVEIAKQAGANGALRKPFDEESLSRAITGALSARKHRLPPVITSAEISRQGYWMARMFDALPLSERKRLFIETFKLAESYGFESSELSHEPEKRSNGGKPPELNDKTSTESEVG
jgi:CheY-like chemotaxis protein